MSEYGLIGKKLGHSYSADYFSRKFAEYEMPDTYNLFPIPSISVLPALIESHRELKGLNVTIPYKEDVLKYCDILSEDVENIGAANVLKIIRQYGDDGAVYSIKAYNTDWHGFAESLLTLGAEMGIIDKDSHLMKDALIFGKHFPRALVLGTGGAAKAVVYSLRFMKVAVTLVSRTPEKVKGFTDCPVIGYKEITKEVMDQNLLIVNTTPCGMYPDVDEAPDIPYQYFSSKHVAYDLIYNPEETKFMRLAKEHGATVKNGLDMLYNQAELAWSIWDL